MLKHGQPIFYIFSLNKRAMEGGDISAFIPFAIAIIGDKKSESMIKFTFSLIIIH